MKSTFRTNLLAGFGLSLLLLIGSSFASYFSIAKLIQSSGWVDHTHQVITTGQDMLASLQDGETGQRGYLLTKNTEYLEPYNGAYTRTMESFRKLKELTRDNKVQQENCDTLESLINKRFSILQLSIDTVKIGKAIDVGLLSRGKITMEQTRQLVKRIISIEQDLLAARTKTLQVYTTYTPIIIIVAAVLAILITAFFFNRVLKDFRKRIELNEALKNKETEIANRIRVTQDISQRIAQGDYSIRLSDEDKDDLGIVAGSLNKMAASLDQSFKKLSGNEWLQSGAARLGEKIAGEKDIPALAADVIHFIANYTHCITGAIYVASDNNDGLQLAGAYALPIGSLRKHLGTGEEFAGQVYKSKQELLVGEIDDNLYVSFSGGSFRPRHIFVYPVLFEGEPIAVIELATIHDFTELQLQYLRNSSEMIGIGINTARNRTRLKELLEETQAQSEELQVQQRELEDMNSELEAQAEKLQTSEEELKVQQEELIETNQALEERSGMLEEKNNLIGIRNAEIQKKAEELEQSTRYKSEFLANMSHELRTPLNSILLLSRLLKENKKGNLNTDQIEYADVISSSGNSLLQLIDEILDLSRIESGKLTLDYQKIPVQLITDSMRRLFSTVAQEKNIDLNIDIAADVPAEIETDLFRVEQILKNLIANAIKFTQQGGIELKLSLSSSNKDIIEFAVIDTGIGIAADQQEAIFEAFRQADGSTKRKYGGTGLGLSISRQLARLLSGDILLESKENKGSRFVFYMPVSSLKTSSFAEQTNEIKPPYTNRPNLIASAIPAAIDDDRKIIVTGDKVLLIVEDDIVFAKALLDFVREKGYKGIVLVRGDEVLETAKLYSPQGILLDIQLPVKDGFRVMEELKADAGTRHIPVHTMSSFEAKKESLHKGAIDFINKPLLADQMHIVIQKIEAILKNDQKKVLILEDNMQHGRALAYFLSGNGIQAEMSAGIDESIRSLQKKEVNCVILDMGIPGLKSYEALDALKKNESLQHIPIIIFTGKSISKSEEQRIRQYADSIIIKTANSYQRILDEVSIFLHLVGDRQSPGRMLKKGVLQTNILANKTVLVTDDDLRNVFALTKALEMQQMKVITTTSGKEALEALETNNAVDLVLMDIMMPGIDGLETISLIRKNNRWKKLPVIAVTAKAMTGDREKCIQAGASDYITKPVDTDQLISLMRIWLHDTNESI